MIPRVRLSIRRGFLDGRDFGNRYGDLRRAFGTAALEDKKQREGLALLIATALQVRSVNLNELAAALPRAADRLDMRYQWISRGWAMS